MKQKTLTGVVLDERIEISLVELCETCSTSAESIAELVEEGVLQPTGREQASWQFSGSCLLKVRTAMRLQHDLQLNIAGVALALELIAENEALRQRIGRLESDT